MKIRTHIPKTKKLWISTETEIYNNGGGWMDSPRVYARNAHCTHTTHFIVSHFCVSAVVFFPPLLFTFFFQFVLCFVFYISNVICSLFKWILWDTTRHLFTSTTATVLAKTWKSLALRHEYGFFVLLLFLFIFFLLHLIHSIRLRFHKISRNPFCISISRNFNQFFAAVTAIGHCFLFQQFHLFLVGSPSLFIFTLQRVW